MTFCKCCGGIKVNTVPGLFFGPGTGKSSAGSKRKTPAAASLGGSKTTESASENFSTVEGPQIKRKKKTSSKASRAGSTPLGVHKGNTPTVKRPQIKRKKKPPPSKASRAGSTPNMFKSSSSSSSNSKAIISREDVSSPKDSKMPVKETDWESLKVWYDKLGEQNIIWWGGGLPANEQLLEKHKFDFKWAEPPVGVSAEGLEHPSKKVYLWAKDNRSKKKKYSSEEMTCASLFVAAVATMRTKDIAPRTKEAFRIFATKTIITKLGLWGLQQTANNLVSLSQHIAQSSSSSNTPMKTLYEAYWGVYESQRTKTDISMQVKEFLEKQDLWSAHATKCVYLYLLNIPRNAQSTDTQRLTKSKHTRNIRVASLLKENKIEYKDIVTLDNMEHLYVLTDKETLHKTTSLWTAPQRADTVPLELANNVQKLEKEGIVSINLGTYTVFKHFLHHQYYPDLWEEASMLALCSDFGLSSRFEGIGWIKERTKKTGKRLSKSKIGFIMKRFGEDTSHIDIGQLADLVDKVYLLLQKLSSTLRVLWWDTKPHNFVFINQESGLDVRLIDTDSGYMCHVPELLVNSETLADANFIIFLLQSSNWLRRNKDPNRVEECLSKKLEANFRKDPETGSNAKLDAALDVIIRVSIAVGRDRTNKVTSPFTTLCSYLWKYMFDTAGMERKTAERVKVKELLKGDDHAVTANLRATLLRFLQQIQYRDQAGTITYLAQQEIQKEASMSRVITPTEYKLVPQLLFQRIQSQFQLSLRGEKTLPLNGRYQNSYLKKFKITNIEWRSDPVLPTKFYFKNALFRSLKLQEIHLQKVLYLAFVWNLIEKKPPQSTLSAPQNPNEPLQISRGFLAMLGSDRALGSVNINAEDLEMIGEMKRHTTFFTARNFWKDHLEALEKLSTELKVPIREEIKNAQFEILNTISSELLALSSSSSSSSLSKS